MWIIGAALVIQLALIASAFVFIDQLDKCQPPPVPPKPPTGAGAGSGIVPTPPAD
jgi:hypothetical protein